MAQATLVWRSPIVLFGKTHVFVRGCMSQAEELLMDRIEENEKRICKEKEKKKRLLKSLEEAMEKAQVMKKKGGK